MEGLEEDSPPLPRKPGHPLVVRGGTEGACHGIMARKRIPHAPHATGWRNELFQVIFGVDTPAGKAFDVALIASILFSLLVVVLDSVVEIEQRFHGELVLLEWIFTGLFTVEYLARLLCVYKPRRYALSLFGLVDLLALLPTYLSLMFAGTQALMVIRTLRLLRIFRVFHLTPYIAEADVLMNALRDSRNKIVIFVTFMLSLATIMGALMYWIEGAQAGFTSIPRGMYWAIVTMTTVGYGDIAPQSVPGQFLAGALMILGYGIIAVPTGIVSAQMVKSSLPLPESTLACHGCGHLGHDNDAQHCKFCGGAL